MFLHSASNAICNDAGKKQCARVCEEGSGLALDLLAMLLILLELPPAVVALVVL